MTPEDFSNGLLKFLMFDNILTAAFQKKLGDMSFTLHQCAGIYLDPTLVKRCELGFYSFCEIGGVEYSASFHMDGFSWAEAKLIVELFKLKYTNVITDEQDSTIHCVPELFIKRQEPELVAFTRPVQQ